MQIGNERPEQNWKDIGDHEETGDPKKHLIGTSTERRKGKKENWCKERKKRIMSGKMTFETKTNKLTVMEYSSKT